MQRQFDAAVAVPGVELRGADEVEVAVVREADGVFGEDGGAVPELDLERTGLVCDVEHDVVACAAEGAGCAVNHGVLEQEAGLGVLAAEGSELGHAGDGVE